MKTQRTLIAMCVAALFTSTAAIAKDKWEYHESAWDSAKSYGNVTIGSDSVSQWGPWEDFVEPAAGGPTIAFIGGGSGDPYRPIPPIPVGGCGDGEWCGYMAISNDYSPNSYYGRYRTPPYINRFEAADIALQFDQPESGWRGHGGVNLILRSDLSDYGATAGMETGMVPVMFWGKQGWFDGHAHDPYVSLEGGFDGYNRYTHTWVNKYATMGVLRAYVNGVDVENDSYAARSSESESDGTWVYAPFVAGQLTSSSDMSALRASNITAWYKGETALARGDVCMTVQFGSGTWNGVWNHGYRVTGFSANGTINGANFASTNVTGSSVVSSESSVRGSFYGPQAAALGGVVDVTKTAGYVNYSIAESSSMPTTRYVDVFLANKTNQTSTSVVSR